MENEDRFVDNNDLSGADGLDIFKNEAKSVK